MFSVYKLLQLGLYMSIDELELGNFIFCRVLRERKNIFGLLLGYTKPLYTIETASFDKEKSSYFLLQLKECQKLEIERKILKMLYIDQHCLWDMMRYIN